jgi:hypothetical protein
MWRLLAILIVGVVVYGAARLSAGLPGTTVGAAVTVVAVSSPAAVEPTRTPWWRPTPVPRPSTKVPTFTRFYPTATPTVICPTPQDGRVYTLSPDGCWR